MGAGRLEDCPPGPPAVVTPLLQFSQFRQRQMTNPYAQQILSQGKEPSKAPAPKATYPRTIGARTFETEAEYQEALADFLNGY